MTKHIQRPHIHAVISVFCQLILVSYSFFLFIHFLCYASAAYPKHPKVTPLRFRVKHPGVGYSDKQAIPSPQCNGAALLLTVHVVSPDPPVLCTPTLHNHRWPEGGAATGSLMEDVLDQLDWAGGGRQTMIRGGFLWVWF